MYIRIVCVCVCVVFVCGYDFIEYCVSSSLVFYIHAITASLTILGDVIDFCVSRSGYYGFGC